MVGEIGPGLLVLVGVTHDDTESDADALAAKLTGLRIFADEDDKMNRSVIDVAGSCLIVSQFTLYGDVRRGRRPSFTGAADPDQARHLVDRLCANVRDHGVRVATGEFGAMMAVRLTNDGPVTLILEASGGHLL